MKHLQKIIAISTLYIFTPIFCCEKNMDNSLIIRPATRKDLTALGEISLQQYNHDFKPLWTKYYAPKSSTTQDIDTFVHEKLIINNKNNEQYVIDQENGKDRRLIVAESVSLGEVLGFCRFEKRTPDTMYINFIVVDKNFRKYGIAKQLAHKAMNTFDGVTECQFRALVHYDFINSLYSKHGCIQKGTIALDPNTGQISTDPNAPITHIDYSFTVQK